MKKSFDKSIYVFIFVLIIIHFTGCGISKPDEFHNKLCFIYTDGLLDDLCAIEYLSEKYDSAIILLQDAEGLGTNYYTSDVVRDKSTLLDKVSGWFSDVSDYSDSTDISKADFYLLAPLTEFVMLLKENPSLNSNHTLLMAGDSVGPDGSGKEWNAAADPEAYRYVTENMTNLTQITAPECEAEFSQNGYPFNAEFLDEYKNKMEAINESVCCYDLQAVIYMFK